MDGFDAGMAVASGLMSNLRDPLPDIARHREVIHKLLVSSVAVFRSLQNHLDAERYDCVYTANGRGGKYRAVLRACQPRGVRCLVTEIGHDPNHYELYENCLPHDLTNHERSIRRAWEAAAGNPDRETLAARWYETRAALTDPCMLLFAGHLEPDRLPAGFDPFAHSIALFNSSEDEFAALGDEWKNPVYRDQMEGLGAIHASLTASTRPLQVYLRVHPNLKRVNNSTTRFFQVLEGPNFRVIPAADTVNSNALMRACRTTLTLGSTAGIEAAYWGKPSICAGMAYYRALGGTYNPKSHDELMQPAPPGRPGPARPRAGPDVRLLFHDVRPTAQVLSALRTAADAFPGGRHVQGTTPGTGRLHALLLGGRASCAGSCRGVESAGSGARSGRASRQEPQYLHAAWEPPLLRKADARYQEYRSNRSRLQ